MQQHRVTKLTIIIQFVYWFSKGKVKHHAYITSITFLQILRDSPPFNGFKRLIMQLCTIDATTAWSTAVKKLTLPLFGAQKIRCLFHLWFLEFNGSHNFYVAGICINNWWAGICLCYDELPDEDFVMQIESFVIY